MRKFTPRAKDDVTRQEWTPAKTPQYPIHKPLAIYGRQSTKNQAENNRESFEAQTKGLLERAIRMGWNEGNIIMYMENMRDGKIRHASGRLRIDQREGLSALIERIESGEIGAVMVYQEDRLFRDETGIQYNTFIDICRRNYVIIITPTYTYDFTTDRYSMRLFRDKMQQAADFYMDYSKRLHDLRDRVSERGCYDGRAIPIGYVVDRDRHSKTYQKYIVYEPHAKVIRWLFKRYRELCGNYAVLVREMKAYPALFPVFEGDVRDLSRYAVKRVPGGFHLTRGGLESVLTNVTYIGWWMFRGEVTKKNHAPIVDEGDFWYAFNRLSPVLPSGEENPERKVQKHSKHGEHPCLLQYVLTSHDGPLHAFYDTYAGSSYIVRQKNVSDPYYTYLYVIRAQYLDAVYVNRLLGLARQEYLGDDILAVIEQVNKQKQERVVSIDDQLRVLHDQIGGLLATLQLPSSVLDERSREDTAKKLVPLRALEKQLEEKQHAVSGPTLLADAEEYLYTLNNLPALWQKLSLEKQLKVVELTTESMVIRQVAPHWLALQIAWRGFYGRLDLGYIWRSVGSRGAPWTPEEIETFRHLYPTEKSILLLETFPTRSWYSMRRLASKLRIARKAVSRWVEIPHHLSLADLAFMDTIGIRAEHLTGDFQAFWFPEESNDTNDTLLAL